MNSILDDKYDEAKQAELDARVNAVFFEYSDGEGYRKNTEWTIN